MVTLQAGDRRRQRPRYRLGLTLAMQCDIRFFATDARYGVVQVRRGVVGDAYSHWVLPRLVGIDIAENTAPMSVAASKRLLWDSFDLDREAVGNRETEIHLHLMRHDDAKESVRAHLNRRPPRWTGAPRDPTA